MKPFFLMIVAVAFASVSCERHEFEGENGTKQLHHGHGDHHGDHGAEGGH